MKIFITGISSGLGLELTKQLLKDDHEVWGISRIPVVLVDKNFHHSICDTGNANDVARTASELLSADFTPDAVILNAASLKEDNLLNGLNDKSFEAVFCPNFLGAVNWIKVFLPIFKKRNKGIFIGISSFSAYFPIIRNETKFAYPASKSALNMVFDALRWAFCETDMKFTIFNFGRMGEIKQGFFSSAYKQAAGRIISYLRAPRRNQTIFYPLLNYIILRVLSFVPYQWLKMATKYKKSTNIRKNN